MSMRPAASFWPRPGFWMYAAPLSVAAILGFWDLGGRCFWNDEVLSLLFARQPAADILRGIDPYNPPLYFLGLKAWRWLVGENEALCRVPSVLAGLGAIALIIHGARRIGGDRAGWMAGCLAALSPGLLMYERECRAYPFLILWSAVSLHTWLRLASPHSARAVLAHGCLLGVGLWIHYTAAFWLLAQALTCALPWVRRAVPARSSMGSLGIAALFLAASAPILAPAATRLASLAAGRDLVPVGGYCARAAYITFGWAFGETLLPWRWSLTIPGSFAVLLVGVCVLTLFTRADWKMALPVFLSLCALTFLPLTSKPAPRYASVGLPSVLILIAVAAAHYRIAVFASLTLVFCSLPALGNYYAGIDYHNMAQLEPHKQIADDLRQNLRDGDEILFLGSESIGVEFYLPNEHPYYIGAAEDNSRVVISNDGKRTPLEQWLSTNKRKRKRLWLILTSPGQDPHAKRTINEQRKLIDDLSSQRMLMWKRLYLHDNEAQQKRTWVDKEFSSWRVAIYCYE